MTTHFSPVAWLTPKKIEAGGLLLAGAGIAAFDRSPAGAVAAGCLAAYLVLRSVGRAAKSLAPLRAVAAWSGWPEYGAASLAALLLAFHGGAGAVTTVAGVALVGAGRLRSSL